MEKASTFQNTKIQDITTSVVQGYFYKVYSYYLRRQSLREEIMNKI